MGIWYEYRNRGDGSFWQTTGFDTLSDITPDNVSKMAAFLGVEPQTIIGALNNGLNNWAIARARKATKTTSPESAFRDNLERMARLVDTQGLANATKALVDAGGDYAKACETLGIHIRPKEFYTRYPIV